MNDKRPPVFGDEPVETALAVLSAGWASLEDLVDSVAARRNQRPTIGQLLLISHKLNVHQVFHILEEQATTSKLLGEIAVETGFVTEADVNEVLQQQVSLCPPLLQVLVSRDVLTPDQAESIRQATQARLRQSSEELLASHDQ
jgi:hypothetical protein